ncbi:hypothetical protein BC940DRAFT_338183 [Gongronella butleri]|nr:hypothetical protein BC940DRAFT_338183 [Gongronella butleri]
MNEIKGKSMTWKQAQAMLISKFTDETKEPTAEKQLATIVADDNENSSDFVNKYKTIMDRHGIKDSSTYGALLEHALEKNHKNFSRNVRRAYAGNTAFLVSGVTPRELTPKGASSAQAQDRKHKQATTKPYDRHGGRKSRHFAATGGRGRSGPEMPEQGNARAEGKAHHQRSQKTDAEKKAALKKKGLCMYCKAKWAPGHACPEYHKAVRDRADKQFRRAGD